MAAFAILVALSVVGYCLGATIALKCGLALAACLVLFEALKAQTKPSVAVIASAGALIYFRDWSLLLTTAGVLFVLLFLISKGSTSDAMSGEASDGRPKFDNNGVPLRGSADRVDNPYRTTYYDPLQK